MNHPIRRLAVAAGLVAATTLVACTDDRALSTEPYGPRSFGVALIPNTLGMPSGEVYYTVSATAPAASDNVYLNILTGLDTLIGSRYYTVWIGDVSGTIESFKRATGTLYITRTDTVIDPVTGDPSIEVTDSEIDNISSFQNGGPNNVMYFDVTRSTSGLPAGAPMRSVLITIESTPDAATPSAGRRPLYDTNQDGAFDQGSTATVIAQADNLKFGFYSASADSLYAYPLGTGRGRVFFRGNVLTIEDSSLAAPPRGYFYAAYAIKRDTNAVPVDTLYLGPLTSPFPNRLSLRNADSIIVDASVQRGRPSPQILASSVRVDADTIPGYDGETPFAGLSEILITLESKDKTDDRLGTQVILRAPVPGHIRNPE